MSAYRRQGEYLPDRRGWATFANSQTLAEACDAVAFRGALYAISISPEKSGVYRKSWKVERGLFISPRYGPRVASRLFNESQHAAAVEFGNRRSHRTHHIVSETAAFLGKK